MFGFRKRRKRALVLGMDGVPEPLVRRLAEEGVMPFMGELLRRGTLHRMRSALPEVSNVNWSSFMCGANPGQHGIFGFTDLRPGSYAMTFPSFPDLATDTLWDALGAAGKRCLVINQPGCYPVRSIPGAVVSGFVAVDLKRAVSPQAHLAPLQRMAYKIDVDTRLCRDDADALFRELDACLAARKAAAEYFLPLESWDFAEVIITGTDRLQHFLWTSCAGAGPERERALAYYARCDALCRELTEMFYGKDEPEGLFMLSDHGFTAVEKEFNLNAWLRDEGYLSFEKEPPESYADISGVSVAFAMDPGRIYLHREGRYPKGGVEDDGVLGEIREKLEALEYGGERVFQRVWLRDEIYSGEQTPKGPDLVCTPRRGIDVKGAIKRREQFTDTHFTGMHTWDDAFFWSAERHDDLTISDLRRIVCDYLT